MTRRPAIALAAWWMLPVLSGCLAWGSEKAHDPRLGGVVIDGALDCDRAWVVNCDEAEEDPSAPWILRPLRLERRPIMEGDRIPSVGLDAINLRRGLVVRDFDLRGFEEAIRANATGCGDCHIVIEHGTVESSRLLEKEGPPDECELFPGTSGIEVRYPTRLTVSDVSMDLAGGGVLCLWPHFMMPAGGSTGLYVIGTGAFETRLANLNIEARRPSAGSGVRIESLRPEDAVLAADGIRALGFEWGLEFDGREASIRNAEIACGDVPIDAIHGATPLGREVFVGIWLQLLQRVELDRISVRNCLSAGIWTDHNGFEHYRLSNFTVSSSTVGLYLWSNSALQVAPSVPRSAAQIQHGTVEANALAGIEVNSFPAAFRNVRILDNGRGGNSSWLEGHEPRGGFWAENAPQHLGLSLTDSVVQGNAPYGLLATSHYNDVESASFVDARNNWWGDPNGPRLRVERLPQASLLERGSGDFVSEGVLFAPFRSGP